MPAFLAVRQGWRISLQEKVKINIPINLQLIEIGTQKQGEENLRMNGVNVRYLLPLPGKGDIQLTLVWDPSHLVDKHLQS